MTRIIIPLSISIVLVSCGCSPEDEAKGKDGGRPETQKLKAVDAIGYDGDGLRKSVDGMLNKNDQQKQDLEEAKNAAGQKDDKN